MPLPLFVNQPQCAERLLCEACRGEDPRFRAGWSSRYQMPPGWPNCPYGVPFGFKQPDIKPIEPYLLGVLVDQPESEEAKALKQRVEDRAKHYRPICKACPNFIGFAADDPEHHLVECLKGYSCGCGQERETISRGFVHLGTGFCKDRRWGVSL